jgi:hypothetical protein
MAGSVIDSLVVTLGLDSKGFAEGVKGSTEQLAGFTRKLVGMFVAVKGIEDVVGYFKDLHAQLAEIGFTSKNLGVAGTELKKLGEVSELFGGQMTDAADSVQGLQASIFNLRYKGQISENLVMLQRFGVAYLDASGHARKFRDVAIDASKAIDREAKLHGLDAGGRTQLAQSMGFTGGLASAVAQGGKGLEKALAEAQVDQRALTEKTIQGQVDLDRSMTRLHESVAAQSSVILAKLTPAIEQVEKWLMKLANDLLPKIVAAIDKLINFFKNPPPWLASIEHMISELATALGPTGTLIAAVSGLALLLGAGGPLITALLALPAILAVGAGLYLGKKIADIPSGGLLDSLSEKYLDYLGVGEKEGAGVTGVRAHGTVGGHPAPATPTAPRPKSAAEQSAQGGTPTAMNGGSSGGTNVQIDTINVNTRATDANGIASSIGGAMQRKLLVASADGGQS